MISPKQIKDLARAMHSVGIISLKTPEIELVVHPKPPQVRRKRKQPMVDTPESLNTPITGFGGYTDEEILTWSSAPIAGEDSAEDNAQG